MNIKRIPTDDNLDYDTGGRILNELMLMLFTELAAKVPFAFGPRVRTKSKTCRVLV